MSEDKVKQVTTLSEEEVAARAKTLVAKMLEREIEVADRKEYNTAAAERIKALDATIRELADQVRTRSITTEVDRQPGLPFEPEGDGAPEHEDGPADDPDLPDAQHLGNGSEGGDEEPPPGTEITDPAGVAGPEATTNPGRRRKGARP